jgi:hypothetical protein
VREAEKIESKYLMVCEYCTQFDREKLICKLTNENTGLFQWCDEFERKPITFETENHIPYI